MLKRVQKWRAIRASVVAWVACLRGWCASVGGVGGALAWMAWVACLHGWRASVGDVGSLCLCVYVCFISTWRNKPNYKLK